MTVSWKFFDIVDATATPVPQRRATEFAFITNRVPVEGKPSGFTVRYRDVVTALCARGTTTLVLVVSDATGGNADDLAEVIAGIQPGLDHLAIGTIVERGAAGLGRIASTILGRDPLGLPPASDRDASHAAEAATTVLAAHLAMAPTALASPSRTGAFLLEEDFGHHDSVGGGPGARARRALRSSMDRRTLSRIRWDRRPVIVLTETERRRFSNRLERSQVHVVPLWVDEAAEAASSEPAPDPAEVTIGWFGRLDDERSVEPGLAVVEASLGARPWRWKLVGDSPDPRLVALAERHPDRVVVTGWVRSIAPHHRGLAAALVPARTTTGTKTTILEAWSAGTPVIASRASAASVDAVDGGDLLVFDGPDDAVATIDHLLADPNLTSGLAASGRARLAGRRGPVLADRIVDLALASKG